MALAGTCLRHHPEGRVAGSPCPSVRLQRPARVTRRVQCESGNGVSSKGNSSNNSSSSGGSSSNSSDNGLAASKAAAKQPVGFASVEIPASLELAYESAGSPVRTSPVKTTGLRRAPLSGGVKTATQRFDLPSPSVAVRNLVEQAQFAHLCTVMSHMHHRWVAWQQQRAWPSPHPPTHPPCPACSLLAVAAASHHCIKGSAISAGKTGDIASLWQC